MDVAAPFVRARELVGSLTALTSLLHQNIETSALSELASPAVTFAQLRLLAMADHRAHWNIGEVAACLKISPAAASKTVDRLVRHRLLRRIESAEDRRVAELSLTGRGRQLLHGYYAALQRRLAEIFQTLPDEDLQWHADFLDHLSMEIRRQEAEPGGLCLHCGIYAREHCLLREVSPELCFYAQPPMPQGGKRREGHGDRHR